MCFDTKKTTKLQERAIKRKIKVPSQNQKLLKIEIIQANSTILLVHLLTHTFAFSLFLTISCEYINTEAQENMQKHVDTYIIFIYLLTFVRNYMFINIYTSIYVVCLYML